MKDGIFHFYKKGKMEKSSMITYIILITCGLGCFIGWLLNFLLRQTNQTRQLQDEISMLKTYVRDLQFHIDVINGKRNGIEVKTVISTKKRIKQVIPAYECGDWMKEETDNEETNNLNTNA